MKSLKAALLLISILLIPIGCSKLTPEELVVSAKQNIEQGKLGTAVVELKTAISQNNTLSEARTLLGSIYLRQSQFEAAEKELLRGADMGAPYVDVYPNLVKVYYYQEDYEGVISLTDRIMLVVDDEVKKTLTLYQYLAKLRFEQSQVEPTQIPEFLDVEQKKIIQATIAHISRDNDKALTVVNSFNFVNTDKVEQFFVSGLVNNRAGELERAAEDFRSVLKEFPNYHLVRFLLIDVLLRNDSLDEAEMQTDLILAINKDQTHANYFKGAIAFERKDFENAFLYSQKASDGRSDVLRNYLVNGLSAFQLKKYEQSYSALRKIAPRFPQSNAIHRIIAQLELNLGHSKAAAATLNSLEGVNEVDAQLFEDAANIFALNNEFEYAVQLFSTLSKRNDPDSSTELREGVSKIVMQNMEGTKNIERSLALDPSNDKAWLYLAEVYFSNNETEKVVELGIKWQETNKVAGLVLEGQARHKLGESQKAISLFSEALAVDESNVPALNNLINVTRLEGDNSKATEYAIKALNQDPQNKYAGKELILLAKNSEDYSQAEQTFNHLVEQHSELEGPLLMLASLLRTKGEELEAINLLEKNRDKLSGNGLMSLGDALYSLKRFEEAKIIYLEWQANAPKVATPWFRLIGVESDMGNIDKARQLTREALQLFPNSEPLRLANLQFLVRFKEYAAARDELQKLRKAGAKDDSLDKIEGQIALVDRKYQRAIALLSKDYQTNKTFADAINLSLAYIGNNQRDEAKEIYEQQLIRNNESLEVKYTAAEFMSIYGYDSRTVELYQDILSSKPNDVVALNNLANAYIRLGKYDQALVHAQAAIKHNSDSPQIMDTYGWALFKAGKVTDAKPILAVAQNKLPNDANITMNYVEVLLALGEQSEVDSLLKSVKPLNDKQHKRLKLIKSNLN